MIIDVKLVAEALEEILPYDKGGEMAKKIHDMMDIKNGAAEGRAETINRASLALLITGDPAACEVMAKAYTKALHAHGILPKWGGLPTTRTLDWPRAFEDFAISRALQEYNHAFKTLNEAKSCAPGGALIIPGIYKMPYAGWVDEEDAGPKARDGALRAITSFMNDKAVEESTPVVILTGEAEPMAGFLQQHSDMQRLFEGKALAVCTVDPPISTELNQSISVGRPLRLNLRKPAFP
jgi:hypothetical protein